MESHDLDPLSTDAAMSQPVTDQALRALLLHRLPEAEAEDLGRRLIEEDGLAGRVEEIEYELLDACASGTLSAQEREDVMRHLQRTPEERLRLHIARGLVRLRAQRPPGRAAGPQPRPGAWRPLAAAGLAGAVAALLFAVLYLDHATNGTMPPAAALQAGPEYAVSLLAEVTRGALPRTVSIPAGTGRLRLQVEVADPVEGERYRLRVTGPDGAVLLTAPHLSLLHAGRHAYVETRLTPQQLGHGARRITVNAESAGAAESIWSVEVGGG